MIDVRERLPLSHEIELETLGGAVFRWSSDEQRPQDEPSGVSWSSTMPGGHEAFDATLPRYPDIAYADLGLLSTVRARNAGGEIVTEARLERTPRVSGDQIAVTPSAVGWQAALADNKSARFLGIDRDLGRWQGPSRQRQINILGLRTPSGPTTITDASTGAPSLETGFDESGGWSATSLPLSEGLYDAGAGNLIGRIRADWLRGANVALPNANWIWLGTLSDDDVQTTTDSSGNLNAAGPGTLNLASTGSKRFASLTFLYNAAGGTDQSNVHYAIYWSNVRVFGDHGLTIRGSTPATEGFYASDLVAHIVRAFAPSLRFTEGPTGTVRPSTFIIPQFSYPEATTAGDLIRQATRFGLEDWAVWEGPTFYWHPRGAFAQRFRARVGPSGLSEAGPQIDRMWESVLVQYQDVDGSTRTVGPPGSGAGTESEFLHDTDPENPATYLPHPRREMLQAGTLTAASAIELGRRFLQESKQLSSSGRAEFVGYIEDEHGIARPFSDVRAGDLVAFTDAADTSYRRIVRASHDLSRLSCTVDLDSPPDGMAALLERLGVAVVPLGF